MAIPYLDHPRPAAFAHRGGAAHNPENSWPAFEYAVKLGYAYLETDARSTSDGALLSFHDATLDRITDRTGQVAKMTYKQVSEAKIAGSEPIPLIEDLLGTFGELRFNIDLKDSGTIEPTLKGWLTESSSSASRPSVRRRQSRFSRFTSVGRSCRGGPLCGMAVIGSHHAYVRDRW